MTWLERAYVAGWLIAFVGSALLHLLIPEQVANASPALIPSYWH